MSETYALIYHVVDDYVARRADFREEHLAHASEAVAAGELLLGGAFDEPADRALLVFRCTRERVEEFARKDPYTRAGLVLGFEIRPWRVVVGSLC